MSRTDYAEFFRKCTGSSFEPFPYQRRLAEEAWPDVIDVPTGLGKTAAVVLAWLYKLLAGEAPRRLVYCLPMRVLVEQTRQAALGWVDRLESDFASAGRLRPTVHVLMGRDADESWERLPERPAIVIGTQDMLLSRALNRGYGMSRFKWPVHFGLLNNDCAWVMDETQLMGVGLETSAQLQALRAALGTFGRTRSVWMSATVGQRQLATVDHPCPEGGWRTLALSDEDLNQPMVRQRVRAHKALEKLEGVVVERPADPAVASGLADRVLEAHHEGSLTLVFVNRVERAQQLYTRLLASGRDPQTTALVHSRFRRVDRAAHEALLQAEGDRIIVATQALEAGVDVSARTLLTELAPWPSLVQRFGRCNRYGEHDNARALWIDVDEAADKGECALPYPPEELCTARELLAGLADCGPAALREVQYEPPLEVRPVLRRKDLYELFDTTPDLSGNDLDVSRYVRDSEDIDVALFWRAGLEEPPGDKRIVPAREELCSVSIARAGEFVDAVSKRRASKKLQGQIWAWDLLGEQWRPVQRRRQIRPGQRLLVDARLGGYDPALGWTGQPGSGEVSEASVTGADQDDVHGASIEARSASEDPRSVIGRWVSIAEHSADVQRTAEAVATALELPAGWRQAISTSCLWHDVGKAHEAFQRMLRGPADGGRDARLASPREGELWAKSSHGQGKNERRGFRHELGSALVYLAQHGAHEDAGTDLVAYLIAGHHGQVRLTIRALPDEEAPPEPERLYARGWYDGEVLPELRLSDGTVVPETAVDLSPMALGCGSWLDRMLRLRDDAELGPLRLGLLEAVLRIADWRASAAEAEGAPDHA